MFKPYSLAFSTNFGGNVMLIVAFLPLILMQTIDLTFVVLYPVGTIENFTFVIEGHNALKH